MKSMKNTFVQMMQKRQFWKWKRHWKNIRDSFPLLTEMLEKARREEAKTKLRVIQSSSRSIRKRGKEKDPVRFFEKIRTQEGKADKIEVCRRGRTAGENLQKELDELEEKEQIWKKQSEELAESEKETGSWQRQKKQEEQVLEQELSGCRISWKTGRSMQKQALKCREIMYRTTDGYLALNSEYEREETAFSG